MVRFTLKRSLRDDSCCKVEAVSYTHLDVYKRQVRLFQSALDLGPRPATKAWVLVYLGKLTLAAEEPEQAQQYFIGALKVEGISDMARKEAENGLRASSKQ